MRGFVLLLSVFAIWLCSFRQEVGKQPMIVSFVKDTLKTDSATGLIIDKDLYMVKAQCTSCHSPMLISQNRFTRDGWKQKIRWMQANHNLWELGDAEPIVLNYLEKYYAPTQTYSRRAPLKNVEWYPLDKKQ
jgi:hypothetical protein